MNGSIPHIILSIAGSDSGAGAGIEADLKSAAACGAYGTVAITALTAQNTCGVKAIEAVSPDMVERQMRAVLDDMPVRAVKSGMLYSRAVVNRVARILEEYRIRHYVLDPVMASTSGDALIEPDTARDVIEKLFPLAELVTPNVPETALITGIRIVSETQFPEAAEKIAALGPQALLLKAGHLQGNTLTDYLFDYVSEQTRRFSFPRIDTANSHGTGCSLSAAITAYLAQGYPLAEAVERGEHFLHEALEQGCGIRYGAGHGPIDHFYNLRKISGQ